LKYPRTTPQRGNNQTESLIVERGEPEGQTKRTGGVAKNGKRNGVFESEKFEKKSLEHGGYSKEE